MTVADREDEGLTEHIRSTNARIRLHDADYVTHLLKVVDTLTAQRDGAEAENARLRDALRQIAQRGTFGPAHDAYQIACQALEAP